MSKYLLNKFLFTVDRDPELVERIGGKVVGIACLIELEFLKGREKLPDYELHTFIHY